MAARAIWKGVITFGSASVPVKLYSAVEDHSIRFRLLHEKDKVPVQQRMVDPTTGEVVPHAEAKKAFPVSRNRFVILDDDDLAELEPEESRDIEVTRFVDVADIDHRWYERAYYLGPDGGNGPYFALAEALTKQGKEGVARWTMRKKSYVGALRADAEGYLMLIVLRHADEVIVAEDVPAPEGRALGKREVEMAAQLVEALSGEFDPADFRDAYRERVLELVETKAKGGKVKVKSFRPRKETEEDLDDVLAASLKGLGRRKAG